MEKVDYKKLYKSLYNPTSKEFSLVTPPSMHYLMIDGQGNPNTSQDYMDAIQALYSVSYKLKFVSKNTLKKDYTVPPLEGLWWADDMEAFAKKEKESWKWTMMIMQPEWITSVMVDEAKIAVEKKGLPALNKMNLNTFDEGLSVQIMHIGSYDDEAPLIARLHEVWMPEHGYVANGKHHEIYLSDPRRVPPEKLKTILRQPVKKQ